MNPKIKCFQRLHSLNSFVINFNLFLIFLPLCWNIQFNIQSEATFASNVIWPIAVEGTYICICDTYLAQQWQLWQRHLRWFIQDLSWESSLLRIQPASTAHVLTDCIHIFDALTVWSGLYMSTGRSFSPSVFWIKYCWEHGWRFRCKESWRGCQCFPAFLLDLNWHQGLLNEGATKEKKTTYWNGFKREQWDSDWFIKSPPPHLHMRVHIFVISWLD